MATIKKEVSFDLSDYFSKYGFGDDGAAPDVGDTWRHTACEILDAALKAEGLDDTRTHELDAGVGHNNCQLALVRDDGEYLGFHADGKYVLLDDVHVDAAEEAAFKKRLARAWKRAFGEFEKRVAQSQHGTPAEPEVRQLSLGEQLSVSECDFDAVEVAPVRRERDENGNVLLLKNGFPECVERCESEEAEFWSVYGRSGDIVRTLCDCDDEADATLIAAALTEYLNKGGTVK